MGRWRMEELGGPGLVDPCSCTTSRAVQAEVGACGAGLGREVAVCMRLYDTSHWRGRAGPVRS